MLRLLSQNRTRAHPLARLKTTKRLPRFPFPQGRHLRARHHSGRFDPPEPRVPAPMALTDFAVFFAWVGAALVVYAGAAVGIGRGWVRADGRLQAAGMLLVVLLAQRATFPKPRRSRGHGAAGVEASVRTLKDEAYFWLPVIAICVLGLVVNASVKAVRRRRQRERERLPPPVPARRYLERRRA